MAGIFDWCSSFYLAFDRPNSLPVLVDFYDVLHERTITYSLITVSSRSLH